MSKAKHFGDSYRGRRKFQREFQDFRQRRTPLEQIEAAAGRLVSSQMEGPSGFGMYRVAGVDLAQGVTIRVDVNGFWIVNPDGSLDKV